MAAPKLASPSPVPLSPTGADAFDAIVQAANPDHPDHAAWVEKYGGSLRSPRKSVDDGNASTSVSMRRYRSANRSTTRAQASGSRVSLDSLAKQPSSHLFGAPLSPAVSTQNGEAAPEQIAGNQERNLTDAERRSEAEARRRRRKKKRDKGKVKAAMPPIPPPRTTSAAAANEHSGQGSLHYNLDGPSTSSLSQAHSVGSGVSHGIPLGATSPTFKHDPYMRLHAESASQNGSVTTLGSVGYLPNRGLPMHPQGSVASLHSSFGRSAVSPYLLPPSPASLTASTGPGRRSIDFRLPEDSTAKLRQDGKGSRRGLNALMSPFRSAVSAGRRTDRQVLVSSDAPNPTPILRPSVDMARPSMDQLRTSSASPVMVSSSRFWQSPQVLSSVQDVDEPAEQGMPSVDKAVPTVPPASDHKQTDEMPQQSSTREAEPTESFSFPEQMGTVTPPPPPESPVKDVTESHQEPAKGALKSPYLASQQSPPIDHLQEDSSASDNGYSAKGHISRSGSHAQEARRALRENVEGAPRPSMDASKHRRSQVYRKAVPSHMLSEAETLSDSFPISRPLNTPTTPDLISSLSAASTLPMRRQASDPSTLRMADEHSSSAYRLQCEVGQPDVGITTAEALESSFDTDLKRQFKADSYYIPSAASMGSLTEKSQELGSTLPAGRPSVDSKALPMPPCSPYEFLSRPHRQYSLSRSPSGQEKSDGDSKLPGIFSRLRRDRTPSRSSLLKSQSNGGTRSHYSEPKTWNGEHLADNTIPTSHSADTTLISGLGIETPTELHTPSNAADTRSHDSRWRQRLSSFSSSKSLRQQAQSAAPPIPTQPVPATLMARAAGENEDRRRALLTSVIDQSLQKPSMDAGRGLDPMSPTIHKTLSPAILMDRSGHHEADDVASFVGSEDAETEAEATKSQSLESQLRPVESHASAEKQDTSHSADNTEPQSRSGASNLQTPHLSMTSRRASQGDIRSKKSVPPPPLLSLSSNASAPVYADETDGTLTPLPPSEVGKSSATSYAPTADEKSVMSDTISGSGGPPAHFAADAVPFPKSTSTPQELASDAKFPRIRSASNILRAGGSHFLGSMKERPRNDSSSVNDVPASSPARIAKPRTSFAGDRDRSPVLHQIGWMDGMSPQTPSLAATAATSMRKLFSSRSNKSPHAVSSEDFAMPTGRPSMSGYRSVTSPTMPKFMKAVEGRPSMHVIGGDTALDDGNNEGIKLSSTDIQNDEARLDSVHADRADRESFIMMDSSSTLERTPNTVADSFMMMNSTSTLSLPMSHNSSSHSPARTVGAGAGSGRSVVYPQGSQSPGEVLGVQKAMRSTTSLRSPREAADSSQCDASSPSAVSAAKRDAFDKKLRERAREDAARLHEISARSAAAAAAAAAEKHFASPSGDKNDRAPAMYSQETDEHSTSRNFPPAVSTPIASTFA